MNWPNQEQVKSAIRWGFTTFGPLLTSHGYAGASQLEMISGMIISAIPFVWGMFTHTQANAVAVVAAIAADQTTSVKGLVVDPTTEGRALIASATPKDGTPVIVAAGTHAATQMATIPPAKIKVTSE